MEIKAKARFIRMSPSKVRLVIDVIRGMHVAQAQTQLKFMNKLATEPVLKLLNSAIANAQNNFQIDPSGLFIKAIAADGGPTLHRSTPRAFGRATPIRKRTTHISIVLDEKIAKTKEVKEVKSESVVEKKKPVSRKRVQAK